MTVGDGMTPPSPMDKLTIEALLAAQGYLDTVESNVVQDHVAIAAAAAALEVFRPYVVIPPEPDQRGWAQKAWDYFKEGLRPGS